MLAQWLRGALVGIVVLLSAVLPQASLSRVAAADMAPPSPYFKFIRKSVMWSQDGELIAFSFPSRGLHVVDAEGTQLWRIPAGTWPGNPAGPLPFQPALSPDGSRVAYVIGLDDTTTAIETARFDGTDVRRLTSGKGINLHPAWSPDGRWLAFRSDTGISIVDTKAPVKPVLVPMFLPLEHAPVWSPDGKRLAMIGLDWREVGEESHVRDYPVHFDDFELWPLHAAENAGQGAGTDDDRARRYRLFTARPDGTELRNIAETGSDGLPYWSPNGKWLAFIGFEGEGNVRNRPVPFTVRPDGTDLLRVTTMRVTGAPVWSPDSSQLAFVSELPTGIITARPDQTEHSRAYLGIVFDIPAWSPDGAWLAFVVPEDAREPKQAVYRVRPDGAQLERVVGGILSHGPPLSWSPDGREIFTQGLSTAVQADGTGDERYVLHPVSLWGNIGISLILTGKLQVEGKLQGEIDENLRTPTAWSPDVSKIVTAYQWYEDSYVATVPRDGEWTDLRVLVRGDSTRLVAEYSNWQDVTKDIAACSEGNILAGLSKNRGLVEDCETLLAVRNRLIGSKFLGWSMALPISAWQGVTIDDSVDSAARVVGLELGLLDGVIPPELGNLNGLKRLAIVSGDLSGEIPAELGNLSNLEYLDLSTTGIEGRIPSELGKLERLKVLLLEGNQLSGNIPPELGNLSQLRILQLFENDLVGEVPRELGRLSNLEELYLHGNSLSGCIPASLGSSLLVLKTDGLDYCSE